MTKQTWIIAALTLALGAGIGYWAGGKGAAPAAGVVAPSERKPLFYRNPMNPEVTSPLPTKDAMGMDYVPVYADSDAAAAAPAGTVTIDPSTVQNIGVRTAVAERTAIAHRIRTIGRVAYDEQQLRRLHPKTEGWVEQLRVDQTGQAVRRGEVLFTLYSPQIVSAQEELLLARSAHAALADNPYPDIAQSASGLAESARRRLQWLDMPEASIRRLEADGQVRKSIAFLAPADGIVMNVGVRPGQFVTPQSELYMLGDLASIWVFADIYEYELPWVRVGDTVQVQVQALPGRHFAGVVEYIYPYLDAKTRTNKLRIRLDNREGLLKPDMYADVEVATATRAAAVVVPAEAVVRSGERERVFVQRAPGAFEPRVVTLGVGADGKVEIVRGVDAGEVVVTSAQFLIDSESSIREAAAKMRPVGAPPTKGSPGAAAGRMEGKEGMEGMQMSDPPDGNEAAQVPAAADGHDHPAAETGEHRHD